MKPKENTKVSETELAKSKAALSAGKKSTGSKKTATAEKKEEKQLKIDASGTLLAPHVTEKAMRESERGAYTFLVRTDATKPQIGRAVEKTYGVHVMAVRVVNVAGKKVTLGRFRGKQQNWRKAVVSLKKGETIEF